MTSPSRWRGQRSGSVTLYMIPNYCLRFDNLYMISRSWIPYISSLLRTYCSKFHASPKSSNLHPHALRFQQHHFSCLSHSVHLNISTIGRSPGVYANDSVFGRIVSYRRITQHGPPNAEERQRMAGAAEQRYDKTTVPVDLTNERSLDANQMQNNSASSEKKAPKLHSVENMINTILKKASMPAPVAIRRSTRRTTNSNPDVDGLHSLMPFRVR